MSDLISDADFQVQQQGFDINKFRAQQCKHFKGHESFITSTTKLSVPNQIASGSCEGLIIVWNVISKEPVQKLLGHQLNHKICQLQEVLDYDQMVESSFENRFLLSCSSDSKLILWNYVKGTIERVFGGHEGSVNRFIEVKHFIVSVGADAKILVWDVNCPRETNHNGLKELAETAPVGGATYQDSGDVKGNRAIYCLAALSDNQVVFGTRGISRQLAVYSIVEDRIEQFEDKRDPFAFVGHCNSVSALLKLKGDVFVSSSYDRTVKI